MGLVLKSLPTDIAIESDGLPGGAPDTERKSVKRKKQVISTPVAVAAPSTDDCDMMYKAATMSAFQDLQDRAKPLPPSDSLFEMVTKTLIAGENADTLHLANSILQGILRKGAADAGIDVITLD